MNIRRAHLVGMILLPWLSIFFLGKSSFKRYASSSVFICLFVYLESLLARKKRWWWFYKKLSDNSMGETPLILGPFFIGTLWILKWTYGNFFRYITTNFAVDSFFIYIIIPWFKTIGYVSLVRMKHYQMLCLFTFKSMLVYLYQFLNEKKKSY